MEGPSLLLAAEQLSPFIGKKVLSVRGNSKIGIERLQNKKILHIFSWGKHLVFQFDNFAIRVHFLMFGSFQATVDAIKVTGDYPTKNREPRLALTFANGHIELFSCSIKVLETEHAQSLYDFTIDIMSEAWNSKKAFNSLKHHASERLDDLLLDQTLFSGVGNIIKNEVLFLLKRLPNHMVKDLSDKELKLLIKLAHDFSRQFYLWRKDFVLKKHYQIYKQKICKTCRGKVIREKTGVRQRTSYYCPQCQI